jgi:predicted AlkP superfamily phosphohydrolase/phosphomutase
MSKKLLLIGWDAADWKTIDRLVDQGDTPIMKGLIERGTRGNLTTLHPVLSPMLWTSIATGKRPFKHGIHGFAEPDPAGGARAISNLGRSTKAVWNILNQQGLRCNVVGWWPSHPVEPIKGVMVSDMFQNRPLRPRLHEVPPPAPGLDSGAGLRVVLEHHRQGLQVP